MQTPGHGLDIEDGTTYLMIERQRPGNFVNARIIVYWKVNSDGFKLVQGSQGL